MAQAHNIQAGGHQILRVSSQVSSHLVKPVGRDAVITCHLINTLDEGGKFPSLSFLRPLTPPTHQARLSGVVPSEENGLSTSDLDAFKILSTWRHQDAPKQFPDGASVKQYYDACRAILKEREAEFAKYRAKSSPSSENSTPPPEGSEKDNNPSEEKVTDATESAAVTTVADKKKKPRLTTPKPWELVMNNVTSGMVSPQVLDLKLGRMKTLPGAERAAEKEAMDEGTTAKSLGVRIAGLIVTCGTTASATPEGDEGSPRLPFSDLLPAGWERENISTRDDLKEALKAFFSDVRVAEETSPHWDGLGSVAAKVFLKSAKEDKKTEEQDSQQDTKISPLKSVTFLPPLAKRVAAAMQPIVKAFNEKRQWFTDNLSILSSSVLIVYDAADWRADSTVPEAMRSVVVMLIDFDRSGPREEHYSEDEIQYIGAINTVAELLNELVN